MRFLKTVVLAASVLVAGPLLAQGDDVQVFSGAGQTNQLDCDGGGIRIEGAGNILTITGGCTSLTVEGASNEIQVDMAPGGRIAVSGASNRVRWTAPQGTRARVSSSGADNRIARAN